MKKHAVWLAVFSFLACGAETATPAIQTVSSSQEAERWAPVDDPSRLGEAVVKNLAALPTQGSVANVPWVGSYWPIFLDSINYRWAGVQSESAPHKYERAFGGHQVESAVSRYHGIDAVNGAACYGQGACGFNKVCALRLGQTMGRCVPAWWGLCHAWATAAILHPEPRHGVTVNGVTFNVMDIKALLTLVYNTAQTKQVSLRCEREVHAIPYDATSRPMDQSCRDSNPGTYHIVLANYIGRQRRSFVEDRSMDQDVWNQPVRTFKVLRMQEITEDEANQVLGVGNYGYPYNAAAQRFVYVMTDVQFIREAMAEKDGFLGTLVDKYTFTDRYEYVLELDASGDIIGGEWVGSSKKNHPDFLWLPLGSNSAAVAGGAIRFDNVISLVEASYL